MLNLNTNTHTPTNTHLHTHTHTHLWCDIFAAGCGIQFLGIIYRCYRCIIKTHNAPSCTYWNTHAQTYTRTFTHSQAHLYIYAVTRTTWLHSQSHFPKLPEALHWCLSNQLPVSELIEPIRIGIDLFPLGLKLQKLHWKLHHGNPSNIGRCGTHRLWCRRIQMMFNAIMW